MMTHKGKDHQMKLDITPELSDALASNQAVVALESTIISHGLPYPENLAVARLLEDTVREHGAIPATIAVLDGAVKIGLDNDDLVRLADPKEDIKKLSRRDLPSTLALGQHGATTVAATMILAERAGIKTFATGGIGGVHRGADKSFDISADLPELARSNVAVVSAGPKAILDIPLTLEYLETWGVPIIGYQTDEMPAFWSRSSGHKLEEQVNAAEDIARIMAMKWQSGLDGGILIANPIPEADEIPAPIINAAISTALDKAAEQGIIGKAVTPFLLDQLRQITNGESLKANTALVQNNAAVASQIAVAYSAL